MPMYIVLGRFTDDGIKDVRSIRQRVEENTRQGEKMGMKRHGWYLTTGQYDFVVLTEAPDEKTMLAQVLGVAGRGVSRSETLRAFTLDEVDEVVQKLS